MSERVVTITLTQDELVVLDRELLVSRDHYNESGDEEGLSEVLALRKRIREQVSEAC